MTSPRPIFSVLQKLRNIFGYKFETSPLLFEALRLPGTKVDDSGNIVNTPLKAPLRERNEYSEDTDGNKKLALVGDAALKLALLEDWYSPRASRERFMKIKGVASNANLAFLGRKAGLEKILALNPAHQTGGHNAQITMANTIEALLGVIYLESGMPPVRQAVEQLGVRPRLIRKIIRDKPGGDPDPFSKHRPTVDLDEALESK